MGLTGYYKRFIKNYAQIAAPLTYLLKKNSFTWSQLATKSFTALKEAMTKAPLLSLPDFTQIFIIETDASSTGIGAVLIQLEHPIAFFSKKVNPRMTLASAYVRELYAITHKVAKWRHYLLGHKFLIYTDQKSIKDLMN